MRIRKVQARGETRIGRWRKHDQKRGATRVQDGHGLGCGRKCSERFRASSIRERSFGRMLYDDGLVRERMLTRWGCPTRPSSQRGDQHGNRHDDLCP